jgi:hypothetical protein
MIFSTLRDLLNQHFNEAELRQLCFDLSIEYENLPGEVRLSKAQSLVEFGLRNGRLPDLITHCQELRPTVEWPDVAAIDDEWTKIQEGITAQEKLQGILPAEQMAMMLTSLHQKEAEVLAQVGISPTPAASLTGSGAIAQGADSTALGERAVQTEQAEFIITGDNNSVQTIIHQYSKEQKTPPDPAVLQAQIGAYLTWLVDWAGTLELRGIQRQGEQVVQLPLEQVYVPLAATAYGWQQNTIDLNEILSLDRRLILTGGPGSGKTTVLLHIAWALSRAIAADDVALARKLVGFVPTKFENKDGTEETEPLPLPIFVPLSAYAAHRRSLGSKDDRTLAAFISHYLFARQTSFALPDDFFRHLLRQGQAVLLLLDGLDEVPDETERAQVRQAIEDLVTGRDRMRVMVTCRSAAYQGRTALGKGFRQIHVRPLETEHISALVKHAYAHLYRSAPQRQQQKTEELLAGIALLEAERHTRLGKETQPLINSPLLVRMLLIVHYRERRLPEQRAELYMKATDAMLLPDYAPDAEMADAIGQLIGGSWEVHRDLVQHLAFHMHQRGDKQGREIEEADLRRILAAEPAYVPLADDFVKLTRLRGALLEERLGSYRFLHLAFQEYLVARYLAEIVRSEGGIQAIVAFLEKEPLLESWWREVILLIAGYFGVTSPQTAQSFLERLTGIDSAAAARPALPPKKQLAAAELAALGWLEWPAQREALRQRLADRLGEILEDATLMNDVNILMRATAGRTLAQLGDTRSGVGVRLQNGVRLPDIVWGEEVQVGIYAYQEGTAKIMQPYRLARYPVTYAQFQCFVEAEDFNDSRWWTGMPANARQLSEPKFPYENHPRERVSWYQATAFCRWLRDKLGYEVMLPHEIEWEVAARYPDGRIYPWGNEFNQDKANTGEGGLKQTTAVGLYPSGRNSTLNLYDLSGNVWEWCRNPDDDTVDNSGKWRVVRGGSWFFNANVACAAHRYYYAPDYRSAYLGFRLVVVRRPPS